MVAVSSARQTDKTSLRRRRFACRTSNPFPLGDEVSAESPANWTVRA